MLSVFPDFIYLGVAFAPLVIRVSVAIALGSLAVYHLRRRSENRALVSSIVPWLKDYIGAAATIGPLLTLLIAILLFLGLLTQVAAIGAAIVSLKMMYFKKKFPTIALESRSFYLLLFVLSLLLVFSGAGPFAFDIPL